MDFTLVQMWEQMGVVAKLVVFSLVIMSIVTVAVTVERSLLFRRAERESRELAVLLKDLLADKKFEEAASAAARFNASHIAPVIRSGITEYLQAKGLNANADYDLHGAVKSSIERSAARQMSTMRKGLASLATIGSTAPFVGLFGTTFGIINSFQGMAKEGGGGLGSIAAGIAEALLTTAVGIGVAIVAVLIYNYFTAKLEGYEVDTNESAGEVMTLLAREHASRT